MVNGKHSSYRLSVDNGKRSHPILNSINHWIEEPKGRWLIAVVLLIVIILVIPPVSIPGRVLASGFTSIDRSGGTVSDPDGARLRVLPGASPMQIRLMAIPRSEFLDAKSGSLAKAASAIPNTLQIKSPYYQIELREGKAATPAILTVPIPNDAEPWETLDLYAWTGKEWRWLPTMLNNDDEVMESELTEIPLSVAVMQNGPIVPTAAIDLDTKETLSPEVLNALAELDPRVFYLVSDGMSGDKTIGGEGSAMANFSQALNQSSGSVLLPTLTNVTAQGIRYDLIDNILIDPKLRDQHVADIVDLVTANSYIGIDIDYRKVDGALKGEFTAFIQSLAEKLHASGRILSLRVSPPVQVAADRWDTGPFDWRAIGQAVDSFKLSAYDDPAAYKNGGPMEAMLRYAVSQVPRYKVQLQLSAMSQDRFPNGAREVAYSQALERLLVISVREGERAIKPGATVTLDLPKLQEFGFGLDPDARAYRYTFIDIAGTLHTIWLGNATSLSYKLSLAERFRLKGVLLTGISKKGSDPEIWEVMRRYQKGEDLASASQMAVVWNLQSKAGDQPVQELRAVDNPSLTWTIPQTSGDYTIAVSFSATNNRAASPIGSRVAMNVSGRGGTISSPIQGATATPPVAQPTPAAPQPASQPTPQPAAQPTSQPAAKPTAVPTKVAASSFKGKNMFDYGFQINWTNTDRNAEMKWITSAGFNWAKVQIRWCDFEGSRGNIDYGQMDDIVAKAKAHGVKMLFSVVCAPGWSRADGGAAGSGPPDDMNEAARFMGEVAGRYCGKGLDAIEVWNEHNLLTEWHGKPISASLYMDMLKASYRTIKDKCPDTASGPQMWVVSGAPTPTGVNDGVVAIDDVNFIEQLYQLGLKDSCDAVGAHPSGYNCPADADWQMVQDPAAGFKGPFTNRNHSWCFRGTMESYRNVMVAHGDASKQIWATEFGWAVSSSPAPGYGYASDNTEAEQAEWLVQAYKMAKGWGWAGVMFAWNLDFMDMNNETGAFHILGRAAYNALAGMPK